MFAMENSESQLFTAIWDGIFHIPHFHKAKNILHQLWLPIPSSAPWPGEDLQQEL